MITVTMYKTEDGRLFPTEQEARRQEEMLDLSLEVQRSNWFLESAYVDSEDVANWLLRNYNILPKG